MPGAMAGLAAAIDRLRFFACAYYSTDFLLWIFFIVLYLERFLYSSCAPAVGERRPHGTGPLLGKIRGWRMPIIPKASRERNREIPVAALVGEEAGEL